MARQRIDIRGQIYGNDWKEVLDYFGVEHTVPADVQKTINLCADGDDIDVYINSGGGEIFAGSEIYTIIREAAESGRYKVNIYITGMAASAASVIAMAAHSAMSPTAQLMVHCVSTVAAGNHETMEHTAEELRTADRALCQAYVDKSGMDEEDAIAMMEHETWLTAQQAKEKGLVDEIMFENIEEAPAALVASTGGLSMAALQRMKDAMLRKPSVPQEEKPAFSPADIVNAQKKLDGILRIARKQ
jgi:ATP-dependent protease ClpP protease subunit